MKVMLFDASPRKRWNTHLLLSMAELGAKNAGADTEYVRLYDYKFQGCISCFACKRKGNTCNGVCAVKDEITDILHRAMEADVLLFASPVYLHGATSQLRAFLERLLFPTVTYLLDSKTGKRLRYLQKMIPTGIIYSMNNKAESLEDKGYPLLLGVNGELLKASYGHNEVLYVHNTWQFSDYDQYEVNMFDLKDKQRQRDEQFPKDLQKAYEMGRRLVDLAREGLKEENA